MRRPRFDLTKHPELAEVQCEAEQQTLDMAEAKLYQRGVGERLRGYGRTPADIRKLGNSTKKVADQLEN